MQDTFSKLLKQNYERYGDRKVAIRRKDFGVWQRYTWKDYYEKVKYFSLGLISMGLEPGDKVSILGENDPEWYWASLATQAAGAAVVGIFVDCMPQEVKYYAGNSDSKFILAHDQEQIDKVLKVRDELTLLKKTIYWDPKGLWYYQDPFLMSFDEVLELGREYEKTHPGLFEENVEKGKGDDVALILYTSGTTGLPKGAMISHGNVLDIARSWTKDDQWTEDDQYLSCVPPAWITEHAVGLAGPLLMGSPVGFAEEPETVQEDIRDLGPRVTMFGPRQWESLARTVQAKIVDTGFIRRLSYDLFMRVGDKVADLRLARKKPNLLWRALYVIGEWLVFRPVKDKLGLLRIKHAWTGGAGVSPDIIRFFHALGINLKQGYGTSESGVALTGHRDGDVKPETAGPPRAGVEIKLTDEGEVTVRGVGLFKGYYKNPEATTEKVKDGWFYTGDFGHIDEDGHLIIIDRMEDLRELATGRKFSPQYAEMRLRFSPYIKDALVVGSKDVDYVTAIVNIDFENVGRWAEARHIAYTTFTDLSQKPPVGELVWEEVEKVNKSLPDYARIRRFVNLHKEFDPDEAELTRTRKLRRVFVEDRFRDIIDAVYGDKPEIVIEAPITYRDGRTGVVETAIMVYPPG